MSSNESSWSEVNQKGHWFMSKHNEVNVTVISPSKVILESFLDTWKNISDKARYWDNRFSDNCLEVVLSADEHKKLLNNQLTEQQKKSLQQLENIRQQYLLLLDGKIGVYQFALGVGVMFD